MEGTDRCIDRGGRIAREGAVVVINGRDPQKLAAARDRIAGETGGAVEAVAADIGTIEGRKTLLEAAGAIDILVNNNSGPPPGHFANWDESSVLLDFPRPTKMTPPTYCN